MMAPWHIIDAEIERRHEEMCRAVGKGWTPDRPTRGQVAESLLGRALQALLPEWSRVHAQSVSQWLDLGESNQLSTEEIQGAIDGLGLGADGDRYIEICLDNTESTVSYRGDPNGGATATIGHTFSRGSRWCLRIHPDASKVIEWIFDRRVYKLDGPTWASLFSGFKSKSCLEGAAYEVAAGRDPELTRAQIVSLATRLDDVVACWGQWLSSEDIERLREFAVKAEVSA